MIQLLKILKILTIYFDTCCYGRPQDDQTQPEIEAETLAILDIIKICRAVGHRIFESAAVENELLSNPDVDVRAEDIKFFKKTAKFHVDLTAADFRRADEFMARGLDYEDSVHLAAAESAKADFLITVDKRFERIATREKLSPVTVINPLQLI